MELEMTLLATENDTFGDFLKMSPLKKKRDPARCGLLWRPCPPDADSCMKPPDGVPDARRRQDVKKIRDTIQKIQEYIDIVEHKYGNLQAPFCAVFSRFKCICCHYYEYHPQSACCSW